MDLGGECLKRWDVAGFFFIFFAGALLHFAYEVSGENVFVGALTPVNESVWEHLKLVFLPGVILFFMEIGFCKGISGSSLLAGKTLGIYIMCGTILGGFYLYTLFVRHNLIIDLLLMAFAIYLGQAVSFKIASAGKATVATAVVATIFLIALGAIFVVFTFRPPELEPFRDSLTGKYGTG